MVTGSLATKSDKYYAVINYYENNGPKKRKQKWINLGITTKEGKRKAQQKLKEYIKEYNDIYTVDKENTTITRVTELYIEENKNNLSIATINNYQIILDAHIKPFFSNRNNKIRKIEENDIREYYQYLENKGLKNSSVEQHRRLLSSVYNYGVRNGYVKSNIIRNIRRPRKEAAEINYYTISQLNTLLQNTKESDIYTEILITVFLGLRREEVLGLTWDSIDFEKKTVRIKKTVKKIKNEEGRYVNIISDKMKTEYSKRVLVLPDPLAEYLKNMMNERNTVWKTYTDKVHTYDDFICLNSKGNILDPVYLSNRFKQTVKKIGLPDIHFHGLRHSCASMLIYLGFPMKVVQTQLGHSDIRITANVYSHIYEETMREVADKTSLVLQL